MKHLLLTLDYELFGNGSGDVFEHIIRPTEAILRIAERHNAGVTIFFEVIEYWRLKEQWEAGNRMGYASDPIKAMEEQVREAYRRGHDVQLHLHPQWINAEWVDGHWVVDNSYWRLSSLSEEELVPLFTKGKETLEGIIGDPHYRCHTLRVGYYNCQPSMAIVKAMQKCGLTVDSSVYPGGYEHGYQTRFDYRMVAPDVGEWYCADSLEQAHGEPTDIRELPIVAFPVLRLQKYLSIDRLRAIWRNRRSASESFASKTATGGGAKSSLLGKITFFFGHEAQTWDYCLFSKSMHRSFIKKVRRQEQRSIFVLIGHPKSFVSGMGLEYLLRKAAKEEYDFPTISNLQK